MKPTKDLNYRQAAEADVRFCIAGRTRRYKLFVGATLLVAILVVLVSSLNPMSPLSSIVVHSLLSTARSSSPHDQDGVQPTLPVHTVTGVETRLVPQNQNTPPVFQDRTNLLASQNKSERAILTVSGNLISPLQRKTFNPY